MEDERSEPGKMQQVWRVNDASQSLQELWLLQQKRNHCNGLICREVKELSIMLDSFLYNMMLGSKAPTMMPADVDLDLLTLAS